MKKTKLLITVLAIILLSGIVFASEGTPEDIGLKPSPAHLKWGDRDTEVYTGDLNGASIATDFSTNNLYTVVNANVNQDSLILLKSENKGEDWSVLNVRPINDIYNVFNPQIIVTDAGRIAIFARYEIISTSEPRLYVYEMEDSSGTIINENWEQIDDPDYVDSIYSYDVDYADGYYYVTYLGVDTSNAFPDSNYVMALTCHEDSSSWPAGQDIFWNPQSMEAPAVGAGANGNVYVAFIEERIASENQIRVRKSYDYGATWEGSQQVSNVTSTTEISNLDVDASHSSSYQNVWFTVQYDNASTFGYYYSDDSCATTQYGGVIDPALSGWTSSRGTIDVHPISGYATVAFKYDSSTSHDVYFSWARNSDPNNFYAPEKINQYDATNIFRPQAASVPTYSAVIYAGWGPQNLYFDYYGSTLGIDSDNDNVNATGFIMPARTVFSDNIEFSLMLNTSSSVDIALFDCSGRKVLSRTKHLSEGSSTVNIRTSELPSGIYLYRAVSGEKSANGRLIKLK
ncbi:MAG: T9SS type A sorting domain-containing protein [bacterium]